METTERLLDGAESIRRLAADWLGGKGGVEAVGRLETKRSAVLDGAWGSSCALAAAAIALRAPGVLLVVCSVQGEVDPLCDDLELFSSRKIERFPAWETSGDQRVVYDEIYGQRLRVLKLLSQPIAGPAPIVVAPIQSLLQSVPSVEAIQAGSRILRVGQALAQEELIAWLVERGFESTSAVQLPGELSMRGGIVDVFAPAWDAPVRVEFFGDEIESLRRFDVADQRSLGAIESADITIFAPDAASTSLCSHLSDGAWAFLVEPPRIQVEAKQFFERLENPIGCYPVETVFEQLSRLPLATAEAIAAGSEEGTIRLGVESIERLGGDVHRVGEQLDSLAGDDRVVVVCPTEAETKRLEELFAETALAQSGRLQLIIGRLHAGFRLADSGVTLVGSDQLFQRTATVRPVRRHLSRALDSFLDLRPGDLVVHLSHGIARYRGLQMLETQGQAEEHLELEFDGRTRIYVPASKINLVQKYVGGAKRRPALAKIGGKTWVRQKQAAERAVVDLAADMLELQASRHARPGIAFPPDSPWQHEFDASFPYQETPDQLTAIEAIKSDMQQPRPMDRLLCGDVGFGKTELSIRTAFKAIENGYQVAVLAPTTVLVEQHFRTFTERLAEFPFAIARLSRFCSSKEESQTIRRLADGSIDLVVGTHRLASHDVSFKNLGLVMIDEEQRFGVAVKERLKAIRRTVDVLTMTATPIPRTLHMSLLGLRDISNLETPPEERIAVDTHVGRFDENVIRQAILRELNRGGQVYFVHNRVADIQKVAQQIARIVPEATWAIGHGQMPEGELEQVMYGFVDHRFDVLIATTIVESGLDIPNANTMFIDDADRYGLADLHQLRGRVGRGKHRAYCYLLVDPAKHLTPNAARRLKAIEEFSRLGAGFAIAMRDLEIRGAGNILGTEQSGHISAVGYELYCQLLEQAVRRLKQMAPAKDLDVHVDLPIPRFIPDEYVPDRRIKIDLYRRLARIASSDDLNSFTAEISDRFGSPPAEVGRLLEMAELRIAAEAWRIDSIHVEDGYLVLEYKNRPQIEKLAAKSGKRLRVVDGRSAYLPLGKDVAKSDAILAAAKSLLLSD